MAKEQKKNPNNVNKEKLKAIVTTPKNKLPKIEPTKQKK